MTPQPPPHGINDVDYEAIEAAVTETVRGRWFLNEFARRNRTSEMRLLLEAMARLEATVVSSQGQTAFPAADPSIRLLVQRIKEIAGQLDGLAREMRETGIDEHLCSAAELQARAVAGMMRNTTSSPAPPTVAPLKPALVASTPVSPVVVLREEPPTSEPLDPPRSGRDATPRDPRLAALSGFDDLPFAQKLALFT